MINIISYLFIYCDKLNVILMIYFRTDILNFVLLLTTKYFELYTDGKTQNSLQDCTPQISYFHSFHLFLIVILLLLALSLL